MTKVLSGNMGKSDIDDMTAFVRKKEYLSVVDKIKRGIGFAPPAKVLISKQYSTKKRTVYVYPREENYVLKLLTFLLIRQYDGIFAKNLYSFRAKNGVKKAIGYLKGIRDLPDKYVYKVDIKDYFNSVNIDILLPALEKIMEDEPEAYAFVAKLLTDHRATLPGGEIIRENRGIMAGTPISSFLANVYLMDLDRHFFDKGNRYARYSDDIITFADDEKERADDISDIRAFLSAMSLSINREKEILTDPKECWDFLGISYVNGVFDISAVSARKLKKKMWRKSRALLRWKDRKGLDNICAVKAFIKAFNKKLYDNPKSSELTWTRWYFPVINTVESLRMLDNYMQDCIRYIATGKRTKRKYDFTYSMMKESGYRSLVHEYYQSREKAVRNEDPPSQPSPKRHFDS